MNSKIIIGLPLSLIGAVIVSNYFKSPPVAFENIRGHYVVDGKNFSGCALLLQPGAGINVFGHFGGVENETPNITGPVRGKTFFSNYTIDGETGSSALTVSGGNLSGTWENAGGQKGTWTWTKTQEDCSQ